MGEDAKAAKKQRLAEALRANLKRRKVARDARTAPPAHETDAAPQPAPEGDR